MSRIVMSCGAIVDALLGGASIFGGEMSWLAAITLSGLTVISPIVFLFWTTAATAYEQPEVLTQEQSITNP